MDNTFLSTIVTVAVSTAVSIIVMHFSNKSSKKRVLDTQLDEILKIGIQNPYFELKSFTDNWCPDKKDKEEKYAAYDLYATLVFNYLERYCDFYNHDVSQIQKNLNINEWVKIHGKYWKNTSIPNENNDSYNPKFVKIVKSILD